MNSYRLTFITPLFSKGSYDDRPEIRPPSIRGQLHWWFRALGGSHSDEKAIFGGVHGGTTASKVVVRVNDVIGETDMFATLPHKSGVDASFKRAFKPGVSCSLHFSTRLGGLEERLQKAFDRTLETWLLLGTLGLRATRAGGSFRWEALSSEGPAMPQTFDAWCSRCIEMLENAPLKFHLTSESFDRAEAARIIVSDTIGGRKDRDGEDSLAQINHPLGGINLSRDVKRKTSPLRFRIIPIAGRFHIAAVWDDRGKVTGNKPADLERLIQLLINKDKKVGKLLADFQ